MSIKHKIKNMIFDLTDAFEHFSTTRIEKKKFRDPKRVKITESFPLTEEQMRQIDELYVKNYGKKIPYTWHQHYSAFTKSFDPAYFPELIYIPEFQKYENLWPEYCKVYSDKNLLPVIAAGVGVKTPLCHLTMTKGVLKNTVGQDISLDEACMLLEGKGDIFVKPTVGSSSGKGCFMASIVDGKDAYSGKPVKQLLESLGMDYCVQEKLVCHDSIRKLYPSSVNTFRIMTYRWKDEFCHAPATMRIGSGGSYLDNIHAGGMCISINDDGTLHDKAFTEFAASFDKHPDTGVVFSGHQIANFHQAIDAAITMHKAVPQVGLIHWDFTIDQNGEPVLIEANMRATSIQLIERPLGKGPFGDKTPEVLRWMRLMRNTKAHKRYRYAFGKMD